MKLVRLFLLLAAVVAAGAYAMRTYSRHDDELRFARALLEARQAYLEVAPLARTLTPDDRYRQETAGLLKTYFAELTDVRNRFPSQRAAPDDKKPKAASKEQDLHEWQDLTRATFEQMRSGGYDPILTSLSGELRLDLIALKKTTLQGKPALDLTWALSGAPRYREDAETKNGARARQITVPASFKNLGFRFIDADGKFKASMSASGEPSLKVDYPERFEPDFPPGYVLGTYTVPAFPPDAAKMELSVETQVRSPLGGEVIQTFAFNVPVQDGWKTDKWEGETQDITEAEMDPAHAGEKKAKAVKARTAKMSWGARE